MTIDENGYTYSYGYENRLIEIEGGGTIVEYDYDALGRRIRKIDFVIAADTTLYYHNNNWQALEEYNSAGTTLQRCFVYGNYIDEVLLMNDSTDDHYYAHDHLYSHIALMADDGAPLKNATSMMPTAQ